MAIGAWPEGGSAEAGVTMGGYEDEIIAWREQAEQSLRGEESWLALVGLHWLVPGEWRLGSGPDSDIRLPAGLAPDTLATLHVHGADVQVEFGPEVEATIDGLRAERAIMIPDVAGEPTRLRVGRLSMILLERDGKLALRVWDRESPKRAAFPGRNWLPVDERYRVQASALAGEPDAVLTVESTLGVVEAQPIGEVLRFVLLGRVCQLVPFSLDAEGAFLAFADGTTGGRTYAGGRYLRTPPARSGLVELDFNRAYNPPCAFTPYATCPLAPAVNRLPLDILAGELAPDPQGDLDGVTSSRH